MDKAEANKQAPSVPVGEDTEVEDVIEEEFEWLPRAVFAELGDTGSAYTDNNDALAELDDLVFSNLQRLPRLLTLPFLHRQLRMLQRSQLRRLQNPKSSCSAPRNFA